MYPEIMKRPMWSFSSFCISWNLLWIISSSWLRQSKAFGLFNWYKHTWIIKLRNPIFFNQLFLILIGIKHKYIILYLNRKRNIYNI